MNTFLKLTRWSFALLFVLTLCSPVAKAGCPTDISPTGIGWTPVTHTGVIVPGTSCTITVKFCFRTVPTGQAQFYLDEIIAENDDCDGVTWMQLIDVATDHIFQQILTSNCGTPPFNSNTIASVFRGTCVSFSIEGYAHMQFCPESYCKRTCKLCWDGSQNKNIQFDCTWTSLGTPECTTPIGFETVTVRNVYDNLALWQGCWLIQCGDGE